MVSIHLYLEQLLIRKCVRDKYINKIINNNNDDNEKKMVNNSLKPSQHSLFKSLLHPNITVKLR
jgi:hypothetical protein